MTDYTKTTDFAAKDSLPSGDSGKIIKGTEFETEFDNIATAIATKSNIASPTFTGTTTIPTVDINGGAIDGTAVGVASASTGAFTTLTASTSLNIASSTTVDGVLDEDNMASDSASKLATQQSIKAYVDSQIGANNELSEVLSNGNTTGGTDISVSSGDDITFADSSKAIFGAGSDLQIYHDGSASYIDELGTGDLYIRSNGNNLRLQSYGGENFLRAVNNGTVELFYDNDKKLETTSTGIDVTGTTSADKVLVSKDGTDHIEIVDASSGQVTNLTTGNTVGYISVDPSNSVANSTFAVYVDGSEYLTVDSTGNVGVGITTPARLLDLETTTANESYLRISGSAGNVADTNFAGIEFYNLDSSAAGPNVASFIEARAETSTGAGGELVFATLPSTASEGARAIERLRIDASGLVGIGTDSPTRKLHVEDASNSIVGRFKSGQTSSWAQFASNSTGTASRIGSPTDDAVASIGLMTRDIERLRIDADGNVGIGETNPSANLHISTNNTSTTNTATFRLEDTDTTTLGNQGIGRIEFYGNDSSGAGAGVKAAIEAFGEDSSGRTALKFSVASAVANDTERMRIDSSGHAIIPAGVTLGTAAGTYNADNTLDDYEEGTWTPTVFGQTTAGTYTLTDGGSTYTKVGRKVTVIAKIRDITEVSAGVGNLNIGGLPFAVSVVGQGALRFNTLDVANDSINFAVENYVTSTVYISESKDNASGSVTGLSAITSGTTDIFFTLTYFA